MVKNKWKKILIGTTIGLIILVPTGLIIMNEMANKALESALPELAEAFEPGAEVNMELAPVVKETPNTEIPAPGTETSVTTVTTKPSAGSVATTPVEKPAVEVVKFDASKVTLADKASAYKLAATKLSASDINGIIQKSKGGFTEEEKEWAKDLFYGKFTSEEQSWILGLVNRYNK